MRNPQNDTGASLKHDPERTCVLTRSKGSRETLIRLALGPDGEVAPDVRARAGPTAGLAAGVELLAVVGHAVVGCGPARRACRVHRVRLRAGRRERRTQSACGKLAGPFAAYQLGLMGADVIKVEHPDDPDQSRDSGSDHDLNHANMGTGFLTQGSNKRAITLNLKTEQGREILKKLRPAH